MKHMGGFMACAQTLLEAIKKGQIRSEELGGSPDMSVFIISNEIRDYLAHEVMKYAQDELEKKSLKELELINETLMGFFRKVMGEEL